MGLFCLLLGGLVGYLLGVQVTWREIRETNHATRQEQTPLTASPASGGALPEGHPTITTQADFEMLKKAVEAAPQNSSLIIDLANKLYDAGRYSEAVRYYEQALALDPNNVNLITDMGTALFYSGRVEEAIAQYDHSLQINPNHAQSLHNLVIVNLQGRKDAKAATAALARLKTIAPNDPSISNLESMIKQSSGDSAASPLGSNPRQRIF